MVFIGVFLLIIVLLSILFWLTLHKETARYKYIQVQSTTTNLSRDLPFFFCCCLDFLSLYTSPNVADQISHQEVRSWNKIYGSVKIARAQLKIGWYHSGIYGHWQNLACFDIDKCFLLTNTNTLDMSMTKWWHLLQCARWFFGTDFTGNTIVDRRIFYILQNNCMDECHQTLIILLNKEKLPLYNMHLYNRML